MRAIPFPARARGPEEYTDIWREVRRDVLAVLEGIPESEFKTRPTDGSWSASDIGEHLYLTQFSFARAIPIVLAGKFGTDMGADTSKHDYMYERGKSPQGIKNPKSVTPSGTWDLGKIRDSLQKSMDRMRGNLAGKTAGQLRTRGMEHEIHGMINLMEWVWVLTLHENSHLQALQAKFGS